MQRMIDLQDDCPHPAVMAKAWCGSAGLCSTFACESREADEN